MVSGGSCGACSLVFGNPVGEDEMKTFIRFLRNDSGATAIEYGLIAALVSVVIIAGLTAIGTSMSTAFSTVASSLQ